MLSHSGVAYSGCEPTSRYRRAPFCRKTLELRPQLTTRRNRYRATSSGLSRRCPRSVHVTPYSFSRPKMRRSMGVNVARRTAMRRRAPPRPESSQTIAAAARGRGPVSTSADRPEAQDVAWAGLGDGGHRGIVDDGDHGIAAGDRVVGEHDDRLAVRRHLDRARDQSLRRQLRGDARRSGSAPMRRTPTRSMSAPTAYGWPSNGDQASNQSSRGPGSDDQLVAAASAPRRWRSACPGPAPIGRRSPAATTGPIRPSVSRLREPSTAGTSMPPRTAT